MVYIFVDFEMEKTDKRYKSERSFCRQEIIEIGAVMLNESFEEISTFKRYVKPAYIDHISRKITELTGITDNYLFGMKQVETELNAFADWCLSQGEDFKVYAWSENDLEQVENELLLKDIDITEAMTKVLSNWNDLQLEYDVAVGATKSTSLTKALESIGVYFNGRMHDALDDSRNTATIFKELSNPEEFQKSIAYIKSFYSEDKKDSGTTIGDLIDFSKFNFDFCA